MPPLFTERSSERLEIHERCLRPTKNDQLWEAHAEYQGRVGPTVESYSRKNVRTKARAAFKLLRGEHRVVTSERWVGVSELPPTKESGVDGIETDPNEIAPMALFGLLIKEQEVETLAKAYLDMKAENERLREEYEWLFAIAKAYGLAPPDENYARAHAVLARCPK